MTTSRNPSVSGNLVSFSSMLLNAPRTNVVFVSGCRPTIKAKTCASPKGAVQVVAVSYSEGEETQLAHGWYE